MTRAQDGMTLTVDGRVTQQNEPTVRVVFLDEPLPMADAKVIEPEEGWRRFNGLIVSDGFADVVPDKPQGNK